MEKLQIILFMGGCMENFVITFKPYLDFSQSQDPAAFDSVSFRKPKLCDSILQKDEKLKENPNILFKTV